MDTQIRSTPLLVIGALGNVGAEVIRCLPGDGQKIRAAGPNEVKIKEKFGDSVEAIRFDFLDPKTYLETFQGVKKMFLMHPPQIANITRDMAPAIEAAKHAGVKHVVFLSIIGVENASFIPHYKVETYLKEKGFQTTFLGCSFFMQNLNTTHRKEIQERNEIFVPVGNAKTSFIDIRDIGAVAARCLTEEGHAGKNYDITGAEALDYWQVSRILSETLGREIRYCKPNPVDFFLEIIQRGATAAYAFVVTSLYLSTRFGMAEIVTNEVERLTGKKPISFKQYTEDYKEAWL